MFVFIDAPEKPVTCKYIQIEFEYSVFSVKYYLCRNISSNSDTLFSYISHLSFFRSFLNIYLSFMKIFKMLQIKNRLFPQDPFYTLQLQSNLIFLLNMLGTSKIFRYNCKVIYWGLKISFYLLITIEN